MTIKNFEFFKRNLNGYIVGCEDEGGIYIDTIYVVASEGVYKVIKNSANDTYFVEFISNFGSREFFISFTMSEVIEYIKEGDKYRE